VGVVHEWPQAHCSATPVFDKSHAPAANTAAKIGESPGKNISRSGNISPECGKPDPAQAEAPFPGLIQFSRVQYLVHFQ
jgi:hypothetical protein